MSPTKRASGMADNDAITIPRDLFERLCEAAIELKAETSWKTQSGYKRFVKDRMVLCATVNEAVAIRDGGKQS